MSLPINNLPTFRIKTWMNTGSQSLYGCNTTPCPEPTAVSVGLPTALGILELTASVNQYPVFHSIFVTVKTFVCNQNENRKVCICYISSSQFSQLSFMQYMGLCVFGLPIYLMMIVRIRVPYLISHLPFLGLGHEAMVSDVCLSIFFCICNFICACAFAYKMQEYWTVIGQNF